MAAPFVWFDVAGGAWITDGQQPWMSDPAFAGVAMFVPVAR
jgi:hypothetical protein